MGIKQVKKIDKIFQKYLNGRIDIAELKNLLRENILILKDCQNYFINELGEDYVKIDGDPNFHRLSDWETYLSYISDRWKSPHRINWIIGLVQTDDKDLK
jgi:hypothetical protein